MAKIAMPRGLGLSQAASHVARSSGPDPANWTTQPLG